MENILLCTSSWGGLGPMAGTTRINIYENGDIEEIHNYHHHPEMSSSVVVKTLNESELQDLYDYIENNIIDKVGDGGMIFDAGFSVTVNYKGKIYSSRNEFEKYEEVRNYIDKLEGRTR